MNSSRHHGPGADDAPPEESEHTHLVPGRNAAALPWPRAGESRDHYPGIRISSLPTLIAAKRSGYCSIEQPLASRGMPATRKPAAGERVT